jgi:hypothetical protein
MIPGSAGFIEIAAQNSSAAAILKVRRGQSITLQTGVEGCEINVF